MNKLGSLYVISTPIGNLDDITIRAIKILQSVDTILCEDTRVSKKLLKHLSINKKLISYNNINENKKTDSVISLLKQGFDVGLISDAGTPLISDPGFLLVRECYQQGIKVFSVPGACSLISALSISSLPTNKFIFLGFLDKSSKKKCDIFKKYADIGLTIVFFESPNRVMDTLMCIQDVFGKSQEVVLAREMTKFYEEVRFETVENMVEFYKLNNLRGEVTMLLYPSRELEVDYDLIKGIIEKEINNMKPSELARKLSELFAINKNKAYSSVLEYKASLEKEK